MRLPEPRGPISNAVNRLLAAGAWSASDVRSLEASVATVSSPLTDADLQLALACCYEMHYRGFADADDRLEWSPDVVSVVAALERRFEHALRSVVPAVRTDLAIDRALWRLVQQDEGPAVSSFLLRQATVGQFRDFLRQRSVYHLREADPHTWQIPRLAGAAKAALVEIQADEYGGGRPARMHATLFAQTLRAVGLDDTYGAYWNEALPETFATVNLMSLLGLHRRHRGALLGHLAALEMTSTGPNRRFGNGLRRLGFSTDATAFFDEHVEADAVHEQIATIDMCGSFVAGEPHLTADVLWGAACCLALDAAAGTALLCRWEPVGKAGVA